MPDTSDILDALCAEYLSKRIPLSVSFRDLVPWMPYNSPRFTHQIHSYPAKVIPQIPHFFLSASRFIESSSVILDPFGGSGTVAVEACLAGHTSIVSDSNPLARLITRVKTTPLSPVTIKKRSLQLKQLVNISRAGSTPDVVNIEYWYHAATIRQLSRLVSAISKLDDSAFKRLCLVALSATARRASLADPRVSVPVRLKPKRYSKTHPLFKKSRDILRSLKSLDAIDTFFETLEQFGTQIALLYPLKNKLGSLEAIYENSLGNSGKSLSNQKPGSVDAIITSPPYLGAQKYIRASSLSLGWLSMVKSDKLRSLEDQSIGREHLSKITCSKYPGSCLPQADPLIRKVYQKNPLRAHIASIYLIEMKQVLQRCHELLKRKGVLVLVSGCNMLSGEMFDTTAFLRQICLELGFVPELEVTDVIRSRGLMTRRNKTASMIPLESVIVFRK